MRVVGGRSGLGCGDFPVTRIMRRRELLVLGKGDVGGGEESCGVTSCWNRQSGIGGGYDGYDGSIEGREGEFGGRVEV